MEIESMPKRLEPHKESSHSIKSSNVASHRANRKIADTAKHQQ